MKALRLSGFAGRRSCATLGPYRALHTTNFIGGYDDFSVFLDFYCFCRFSKAAEGGCCLGEVENKSIAVILIIHGS